MKRLNTLFFLLCIFSLHPQESPFIIGDWQVENVAALQILQVYSDGFDQLANAYLIREEFLEDPLTYVNFDFIDEDLLYITRADGTKLRGFYQIKENSGINKEDYPHYIVLEDKYDQNYLFPIKKIGENKYIFNYCLELSLRDQLLQICCIAYLYR